MNEWYMIGCMGGGGILFAVGGTGPKWIRRFVLPVLLGLLALLAGIDWWRCLGMVAGLIVAFHLGYGEKHPYWFKFLVGITFVLPTLFLGFNVWQIITPLTFVGMFKLSNIKFWSRMFPWKVVEFLTGALIGVTVAQLISQTY